jgi:DNA invertase Pin-like site-specific DNA recombinase
MLTSTPSYLDLSALAEKESKKECTTAVIYARVSPRPQESAVTLQHQVERCKRYAEERGLEVLKAFADDKISGKALDRPGLVKAVHMATAHASCIVAYDLSRLSRSLKGTLDLLEKLHLQGVRVATVTGPPIDTTTHHGRFLVQMMASVNEFFREHQSQLTKDALRSRMLAGKALAVVPYGWVRHKDNVALAARIPQRIIRWLCWRHSQGFATSWLASELHVRGYSVYRSRSKQRKQTDRWTKQGVDYIVKKWSKIWKPEPVALDWYDRYINYRLINGLDWPKTNFNRTPDTPPLVLPRQIVPNIDGEWPHKHSRGESPAMSVEGMLLDNVHEIRQRISKHCYGVSLARIARQHGPRMKGISMHVPLKEADVDPLLRAGFSPEGTGIYTKDEVLWPFCGRGREKPGYVDLHTHD